MGEDGGSERGRSTRFGQRRSVAGGISFSRSGESYFGSRIVTLYITFVQSGIVDGELVETEPSGFYLGEEGVFGGYEETVGFGGVAGEC